MHQPKPPLCKGRWHGEAVRSGLYRNGFPFLHWFTMQKACSAQSLSRFAPTACGRSGRGSDSPPDCHSLPRLRFAYPLHKGALPLPLGEVPEGRRGPSQSASLTAPPKGEPWALPRQFFKQRFTRGNDTEHPPKGVSKIAWCRNEFAAGHAGKQQFIRLPCRVDPVFALFRCILKTITKKGERLCIYNGSGLPRWRWPV